MLVLTAGLMTVLADKTDKTMKNLEASDFEDVDLDEQETAKT